MYIYIYVCALDVGLGLVNTCANKLWQLTAIIYVRVYVCIYIYICIHIHIYIYIYRLYLG